MTKGMSGRLANMDRAGGRQTRLARSVRKEIDEVIIRGMSPTGSKGYQPKSYDITNRGVGGIVDAGVGPRRTDTRDVDNVVTGHATVVKKVTLLHR